MTNERGPQGNPKRFWGWATTPPQSYAVYLIALVLVVRRQHSLPTGESHVCECWRQRTTSQLIDASGALDLTFASQHFGKQGGERQMRSTGAATFQLFRTLAIGTSKSKPH